MFATINGFDFQYQKILKLDATTIGQFIRLDLDERFEHFLYVVIAQPRSASDLGNRLILVE